ncbi:MAG: hypothetical protein K9K81_07975 [Desulfobacteraceae bacterium]|nr:hypothetical protein [Desulfobacteraceae bacterium]
MSELTESQKAFNPAWCLSGRKPFSRGRVFSLLSLFADSADAFAKISKTRAFALKQFEIFPAPASAEFSRKNAQCRFKNPPPALRASLGTCAQIRQPYKTH